MNLPNRMLAGTIIAAMVLMVACRPEDAAVKSPAVAETAPAPEPKLPPGYRLMCNPEGQYGWLRDGLPFVIIRAPGDRLFTNRTDALLNAVRQEEVRREMEEERAAGKHPWSTATNWQTCD